MRLMMLAKIAYFDDLMNPISIRLPDDCKRLSQYSLGITGQDRLPVHLKAASAGIAYILTRRT